MTRQEILFNDATVICVSIMSKRKRIHFKCKKFIGRKGKVLGEGKNGQLLIKFDSQKNPVTIPLSCLHIVTEPLRFAFHPRVNVSAVENLPDANT